MKQTVTQKIIARAAGRESVEPGEYVNVSPDYTCCQEIAWPARKRIMEQAGVSRLARPEKVIMVVDHTTSAGMGTAYYQTHREMKDFAMRNGARFYGPGSGLRHLVLTENGFARPGMLVFSDEPNIASIGVVGALNVPVSSEVVVTQLTDENWMMVPKPVRMRLEGSLPFGVLARDLVQTIIRDFAQGDRLSQSCIEYCGPAIQTLSLDERQSILACSYHAGADTALMPVDELALAYAAERANGEPIHLFESDEGAEYAFEATYDLSGLSPMVTVPPELHQVVPVKEPAGLKIDQAAIGSCANSRLDDLRAAAAVLKGNRVAPHVTFYITPGSREVYAAAAREGLLEIFMEAGATVLAPGCTTCWGYEGFLNPGEVSLSTHQMNYRGRNGSRESLSYLAGPYVVAASAVAGRIADPREMLAEIVQ
ncbi:aconitase family protein [Chelativorans sp. AA-79]|uniref:3-isopropylmalate dehydratase large subunit n=1 Tax=Chelativorans sp. AA-79 TaxID=3028735 RepID=UPI0023F6D3AF|nr:aconitase family protein [Chelativorans sp. AA-79]WEX08708.1 aconitase family protein [Chelativorans sp. AA-79]